MTLKSTCQLIFVGGGINKTYDIHGGIQGHNICIKTQNNKLNSSVGYLSYESKISPVQVRRPL